MEQHKIDNEFKEKLSNREIKPSAHAWDRLDAMLNETEGKKVPVRKLNWLYIAAGILGFILIASMFFTQNKKDQVKTEVAVEENSVETAPSNSSDKIMEIVPSVNNDQVAEKETKKENDDHIKRIPSDRKSAVQKKETAIASSDVKQIQINNQQSNQINNQINQKTDVVKTHANVDELLASANTIPQSSKKSTVKVDASSLLSQVDGELELSFREKIINTVSKNYQKVKVAVSDRNQE